MTTQLRLEIFVADLDAFVDFYTRVLQFQLIDDRRRAEHPYAAVVRDGARLGAVPAWSPVDPHLRAVPRGVELVLDVDDVAAEHDRVCDSGWPLSNDLQERPWGLTDFRLHDPDGHYLRITSRP